MEDQQQAPDVKCQIFATIGEARVITAFDCDKKGEVLDDTYFEKATDLLFVQPVVKEFTEAVVFVLRGSIDPLREDLDAKYPNGWTLDRREENSLVEDPDQSGWEALSTDEVRSL